MMVVCLVEQRVGEEGGEEDEFGVPRKGEHGGSEKSYFNDKEKIAHDIINKQ